MRERSDAHFYVALERYLETNPEGCVTDLAFRQQYALSEISLLKEAFDTGDQVALMKAIYHCAATELPLPGWVSHAYIKGIADVLVFAKYKSWDGAFGTPYNKGTHLNAIRKERRLKWKVYDKIENHSQNGEPISDSLFELVGRELGICKTTASQYYYSQKQEFEEFQKILKTNGIT